MIVGYLNIKHLPLMRQSFVVSDSLHLAAVGGVNGTSEIAPPRYKAAVRRAMAEHEKRTVGLAHTENGLSFKHEQWDVKHIEIIFLHNGKGGVSPSRVMVKAYLVRKSDNLHVVFCVTHLVSWAWTNPAAPFKKWRQQMFRVSMHKIQKNVDVDRTAGWNVVFMGDLNTPHTVLIHSRQVYAVHSGLDHMIAVPAVGMRVELRGKATVRGGKRYGLHTDHPMIARNIEFVKAA